MQNNQDNTVFSESPSIKEGRLSPGSMVGDKYKIVSLIGSGGMGTVYRVQQIFLGKEFALKVLDLHKRSDDTVKRFQQEARTASQLQHPNLVEVHDFDVVGDGQPYLVMDLVEGLTLSEVLKARGALPVDYVVNLCIQICFGLMYAHEKGVVHRDIKPGNIMLLHSDQEVAEGTVKIVDFGIAKLTQSEDGEIQALTKTGEIFGSPIYMSPEQCKGTPVDRRSDIYSLGCVMFECLTGSPPFLGDTAMATMLKRLSDEPASLKVASPGGEFSAVLERIVRRMLAVAPADRYQELGVVIKDLMTLQRPDDGVTFSGEIKEKKEVKKAAVVSKTVLLAAAVVAAVALATIAFDRLIVLPKLISQSDSSSVDESSLDVSTSDVSAQDVSTSKNASNINSTPNALHELPGKGIATGTLPDVQLPDDNNTHKALARETYTSTTPAHEGNPPHIETRTDTSGTTRQFLIFPDDYGTITINGRRNKAQGEIPLPPDARIAFRFNDVAALNDDTLKNLTDLNFRRIDFSGRSLIKNEDINILKKFDRLDQVGLENCDVSSLEPLYNAKTLNCLEVGSTLVSSAEILRIKRLMELKTLTFGPISDPIVVFNALAKSTLLSNLSYKGTRYKEDKLGKGLKPKEVDALSKMTNLKYLTIEACPLFGDDSLKKLLTLQSLKMLKVKDCALTANCVPTLRKFKNLKQLCLTTEGWPDPVVDSLKNICEFEKQKTREEKFEESQSAIIDVDKALE